MRDWFTSTSPRSRVMSDSEDREWFLRLWRLPSTYEWVSCMRTSPRYSGYDTVNIAFKSEDREYKANSCYSRGLPTGGQKNCKSKTVRVFLTKRRTQHLGPGIIHAHRRPSPLKSWSQNVPGLIWCARHLILRTWNDLRKLTLKSWVHMFRVLFGARATLL